MSEHLSHHPKHESVPAHEENNEALKEHLDALKQKAEADSEAHEDADALESIKMDIDQQAISKEDYRSSEASTGAENAPSQTFVSRELKQMGFRRTLTTARMQMRAPARTFSKVIHQPVVEKISEVAGPTVARPSGIMGGALLALLGSSTLLYISKHYGYRFNYLVFIVLFVGGFFAGLLVELLVRMLVRKRA